MSLKWVGGSNTSISSRTSIILNKNLKYRIKNHIDILIKFKIGWKLHFK